MLTFNILPSQMPSFSMYPFAQTHLFPLHRAFDWHFLSSHLTEKNPKEYWHYGIYLNKYTYQKRWKLYLREWFRTKTNMYEIKSYPRILQKRSQIQTYTYICCWHNVHSMNSCRRYILLKQVKSYGYTLLRLASQCRK